MGYLEPKVNAKRIMGTTLGLLHQIQSNLLDEGIKLGSILLKLRLLASRLGSVTLEDWVKQESEGYPPGSPVPEYRRIGVSHRATFSGAFGSQINNAPIPPILIAELAGAAWNVLELQMSVSAIDDLIGNGSADGKTISLERSDLMLPLQGKVYKDMACNAVTGSISRSALVEVVNSVRAKILELTIELERSVSGVGEIELGPLSHSPKIERSDQVTNITHQVVHGNMTTIHNTGEKANISVDIKNRDVAGAVDALKKAGLPEKDAKEFAEILGSEAPTSVDEPLGPKAGAWVAKHLGKAASGVWNISVSVATSVLAAVAKKFYGL